MRDYHVTVNGRAVDTESFRTAIQAERAAAMVARLLPVQHRHTVGTVPCYGTCTGR